MIKNLRTQGFEVDLVCRKGLGAFFLDQKLVGRVFEIEKHRSESYSDALKLINETEYDLCLTPHQSFRTAFFSRKVRAKERIGFKKWWNRIFFAKRIERNSRLPDALRQLSLLREIEIDSTSKKIPDEFSMSLPIGPVNLKSELAQKIIETNFVLLAPGSQWPTKRWTIEGFIGVAKNLKQKNYTVVLIGSGKEDSAICKKISDEVSGVVDLTGLTTISELAFIMTRARSLISNDSGLMHLASVAELPTVSIFGPTTLDLGYRPWQNQSVVVEKNLFCRPCGKHGHVRCPLNTHECMKSISSDMVLEAFKKVCTESHQKELH